MITRHDELRSIEEAIDVLGAEAPRVRESAARLVRDDDTPADVLIVGLIGGTGVGKSTIVNALAGRDVSSASVRRPTTDRVLAYVHGDRASLPRSLPWLADVLAESVAVHDADAIRSLVVLDLPDIDSAEARHAAIVAAVLPHLDILIWVTSVTKYADRVFGDWLGTHARERDRSNFAFVLNKIDEIAPHESVDDLRVAFRERVNAALAEPLADDDARIFLVAARHADRSLVGCEFADLRNFLFRERDAREIERIKSSNRLNLAERRLAEIEAALDLTVHRNLIDTELAAARRDAAAVVADAEVLDELSSRIGADRKAAALAHRLLAAEVDRWPLLPKLRLATAPLRPLINGLRRLVALGRMAASSAEEGDASRSPTHALDRHIEEMLQARRRRASLVLDDGRLPPAPPKAGGRWIDEFVDDFGRELASLSEAAVGGRRDPSGRVTWSRRVVVYGTLVWFPVLQPILEESLNPDRSVGTLPLRLLYRLARITGAVHLLVAFAFVLVVFGILLLILGARATRAAGSQTRRLIESKAWIERLTAALVTATCHDLEDESTRLIARESAVRRLRMRLADFKREFDR